MPRATPRPSFGRPCVRGTAAWRLGRPGVALLAALWGSAPHRLLAAEGLPPADAAVAPTAKDSAAPVAPAPTPAALTEPNALRNPSEGAAPLSAYEKLRTGVLSSTGWGGRGIVRVASAFPLSRGAFTLTARVAYFRSTRLFARGVADNGSEQQVHVAYSPVTGLELALSQTSVANDYATTPARSLQLQGNPTLRVKYGRHVRGPWALGVLGRLTLPSMEGGAGAIVRAAQASGTALVSLQPLARLELSGNVGYDYARARHALRNEVPDVIERFVFGIDTTSSVHWGVGATGRFTAGRRLDLLPFAEVVGHVGTSRSSTRRVNPIQVSVGLRGYPTRSRAVEIALGSDVRVVGGPQPASPFAGLPPWRAFGQVTVHLGEATERRGRAHDDEQGPSFRVRGTALDAETGAPVFGAAVHVAGDEALLLFATNEQTGQFVSSPQAGGQGSLRLVAQAPGYVSSELEVPRPRDGRDVTLTVRLRAEPRGQKLALLKGSLKDAESGAPVVGAELVLPALGRILRSDATGSFAALVKPGRYTAVLRAPGYTAQRKLLILRAGESMVLHVDLETAP